MRIARYSGLVAMLGLVIMVPILGHAARTLTRLKQVKVSTPPSDNEKQIFNACSNFYSNAALVMGGSPPDGGLPNYFALLPLPQMSSYQCWRLSGAEPVKHDFLHESMEQCVQINTIDPQRRAKCRDPFSYAPTVLVVLPNNSSMERGVLQKSPMNVCVKSESGENTVDEFQDMLRRKATQCAEAANQ